MQYLIAQTRPSFKKQKTNVENLPPYPPEQTKQRTDALPGKKKKPSRSAVVAVCMGMMLVASGRGERWWILVGGVASLVSGVFVGRVCMLPHRQRADQGSVGC